MTNSEWYKLLEDDLDKETLYAYSDWLLERDFDKESKWYKFLADNLDLMNYEWVNEDQSNWIDTEKWRNKYTNFHNSVCKRDNVTNPKYLNFDKFYTFDALFKYAYIKALEVPEILCEIQP